MPAAKEAPHQEDIDVKAAVQSAIDFARPLFPSGNYEISLEEIDRSEDEKYWLITLGFERRKGALSKKVAELNQLLYPEKERYKIFQVNTRTGEVRSMKIRAVE